MKSKKSELRIKRVSEEVEDLLGYKYTSEKIEKMKIDFYDKLSNIYDAGWSEGYDAGQVENIKEI